MSKLEEELHRLDTWLASLPETPSWDGHLLAEGAHIERDGVGGFRLVMPCDPVTPEEYSVRFEQLLRLGSGSLKISALGLTHDRLVVSVELGNPAIAISVTDLSISFSGPERVVVETAGWDLEQLTTGT